MGLDLSKSWEFGFNILSVYHNFKKNPHWGINLGVSWGYRSFNIDGNYALLKETEPASSPQATKTPVTIKAVCAISSSVYPY